jgi:PAS domain S-box-containing protein
VVRGLVQDTIHTGQKHQVDVELRVQHEGKRFLHVSTSRPDVVAPPLALVCIEDITERKRAELAIQLNLQVQQVTASILKCSLEGSSRDEVLKHTLDLVLTHPSMSLEGNGAIFLLDPKGSELVLAAQRGIPQEMVNLCGRIPVGKCLCGRAADERAIVFADFVDEEHSLHVAGMGDHGHYCVPIISNDKLYGVLNVFLEKGHKRDDLEQMFLASVADILALSIDRKRAEDTLREREERFDLAVRGSDAGIWDWDLTTETVYFSPRWKSMLGHADHEIGHDFLEWKNRLHPEDREAAMTTLREYIAGGLSEFELEHRLRHKDGTYRWILSRGAAVRDADGRMCRMVGSHIDITQRKTTEQSLREQEAQLVAAEEIQRRLLPQEAPKKSGLDVWGASFPAEFAGGDLFDFLEMRDGSLGIVVGDVSGHGVASALLMASTITYIRCFSETHTSVSEIVARANAVLAKRTAEGRFVSLLMARFDASGKTLEYVNAGHPPAYVLDTEGNVKAILDGLSPPLAIMPDAISSPGSTLSVSSGDLVVFLTDGIIEAMSPDDTMFGMERTLNVIGEHRHKTAEGITTALYDAVRLHAGGNPLHDDVTAVIVKVEAT